MTSLQKEHKIWGLEGISHGSFSSFCCWKTTSKPPSPSTEGDPHASLPGAGSSPVQASQQEGSPPPCAAPPANLVLSAQKSLIRERRKAGTSGGMASCSDREKALGLEDKPKK